MHPIGVASSSFASTAPTLRLSGPQLLAEVRKSGIIRPDDWAPLAPALLEELQALSAPAELLARLVEVHLLTEYQAARIGMGQLAELIVGNYRILDFLGAGGMGMVFKAEHRRLRRPVALKLLTHENPPDAEALARFYTEIAVLAQLQHPNIVAALDAGDIPAADARGGDIHYLVMDYVPGQDLEALVKTKGPRSLGEACGTIYQIASALEEAHARSLVHRDIKPSNIRVTPEGHAKLLDFGVTRFFRTRVTEPGTVLGSLPFLAPEQAEDASQVDIRADLFALGGTLYWSLTGQLPFDVPQNLGQALRERGRQAPPTLRALRPELPQALDDVLATLMATRRDDRYASPSDVMRALVPFLQPAHLLARAGIARAPSGSVGASAASVLAATPLSAVHHVLIVDDEPMNRQLCRLILESDGTPCAEAANGQLALEALHARNFDVVVLDIDMPVMTGIEALRRIRESPPCDHLKVIMVSGRASADEMAQLMLAGADDYLAKPFSCTQLQARVKSALSLKDAQDRSDVLHRHLLAANHDLEQNVHARDSDLIHARNALVLALAELVAYRDTETGAHLIRLQGYCRLLAEAAAGAPSYAAVVDENFINMLECCAPLHDIGKAAMPDHVLLKPGKFTADERLLMQTHTTIGSDILAKVAKKHGFARAFLQMAMEIARSHHERFDGEGYPDRLAGSAIPLAARIVAVADVYDALRCRRVYKPSMSHATVLEMMLRNSEGQFDPGLLQLFERCAPQFDRLFSEVAD